MGCSVGRYAIDQNFKQVIFSVCGWDVFFTVWVEVKRKMTEKPWSPGSQSYVRLVFEKKTDIFCSVRYFFSTSIVNSSFSTATCTLYIYTCISILCHTFAEMLGWTCCNKLTQKLMMIVVRVMMMMPQWGGLAHPENPLHGWGGSDPSRRYKNPILSLISNFMGLL